MQQHILNSLKRLHIYCANMQVEYNLMSYSVFSYVFLEKTTGEVFKIKQLWAGNCVKNLYLQVCNTQHKLLWLLLHFISDIMDLNARKIYLETVDARLGLVKYVWHATVLDQGSDLFSRPNSTKQQQLFLLWITYWKKFQTQQNEVIF